MIKRIVARCHVSDSYQDVIRYVISRFKFGFTSYQAMALEDKAELVRTIIHFHNENRDLYTYVVKGSVGMWG